MNNSFVSIKFALFQPSPIVVVGVGPGAGVVGFVWGGLGEAAAWAGTMIDFTIGAVHLDGNKTVVATPPMVKIFRICLRSGALRVSIVPPKAVHYNKRR